MNPYDFNWYWKQFRNSKLVCQMQEARDAYLAKKEFIEGMEAMLEAIEDPDPLDAELERHRAEREKLRAEWMQHQLTESLDMVVNLFTALQQTQTQMFEFEQTVGKTFLRLEKESGHSNFLKGWVYRCPSPYPLLTNRCHPPGPKI